MLPVRVAAMQMVIILVSVLGACATSTHPPAGPSVTGIVSTPSTSLTSNASVTTSPPTKESTPAFRENGEGARAFTKHFFTVLNDAYRSANDSALRKLFNPSCALCRAWADSVRENRGKGWRLVGKYAEADEVTFVSQRKNTAVTFVSISAKRAYFVNEKGVRVHMRRAQGAVLFFEMKYREGWRMTGSRVP